MNEMKLSYAELLALTEVVRESGQPAIVYFTNKRVVVLGPVQEHPTRKDAKGQPFAWQDLLYVLKEK